LAQLSFSAPHEPTGSHWNLHAPSTQRNSAQDMPSGHMGQAPTPGQSSSDMHPLLHTGWLYWQT
jgi:hypothetical protein